MYGRFVKPFEIDVCPSDSNYTPSLPFKLIDWFLYEGNIYFKLIKIQFWVAKAYVMIVGSTINARSKMKLFETIV